MRRNIRPIPLTPNPESEALALSLFSGRRRELYVDRMVAPGVMFTKEGIHENRIRELRQLRAVRLMALRAK